MQPMPQIQPPVSWRPPLLSWRFLPVLLRNLMVWRKLALPSLLANIAEPLITLVAFGYGLGMLIGEVQGVPYIVFLASGAICMSSMNAATFEALYSAFSRMHVQRTWDGILNTPLNLDDIVLGEMAWAAMKSVFSAIAIVMVIYALNISRAPTLPLVLPVLFLAGITFASLALVFNALARNYDFFSYYFTLFLTPMTFLSGVFFPVDQLPGWLQVVSHALPLTAAVELARPLILGHWPETIWAPAGLLCLYTVAGYYTAVVLTRRRFLR